MKNLQRILALTLVITMSIPCGALAAESKAKQVSGTENVESASTSFNQSDWLNWMKDIWRGKSIPKMTASSTIFGSADTGNKSTLKRTLTKTSGPGDIDIYYYNDAGNRVKYEEGVSVELDPVTYTGEAVFDLGNYVNDELIDSSNAKVRLVDGDGYYVDELVLNATSLDGQWENGKYTYTLSPYDLEWYTGDYEWNDYNSGREWSCFGGDGNGYYRFNLEVSGIKYAGKTVNSAIFPVEVYIWGRDGSDRVEDFNNTPDPVAEESVSGKKQTLKTQWTWAGEGEQPILCDNVADDFYVTWPKGTNASKISKSNVTVTLYGNNGDKYTLSDDQYEVFASKGETQIAVTYMHWSYTPVYTKMKITVKKGILYASKTYDVDSVYVYMIQQGGGGVTVDGTVTTYSYYGFENLTDAEQIMNRASYTLSYTDDAGDTWYYAENEDGNGYLASDSTEAVSYDASGENDCNQQLIVNTGWATTRIGQTEDRSINGSVITFNKIYNTRGITKSAGEMAEAGLVAAPGYILGDRITPYELWSWQDRFLAGYTPDDPQPVSSPYEIYPNGY